MSFTKLSALTSVIAFASKVYSHGHVSGILVDGVYYEGYSTNFVYMADPPVVVGWSAENQDNGFVAPSEYTNADIICHKNATNAGKSATVSPGGTVELQWAAWPESHHGPVINYLAKCAGDCTTDDKTTLEFFKVEAGGLVDGSTPPGTWASDTLIANNNTGVLTIPTDIAPGHYVLRHEIIALHSAGKADGAQNYPQCFNLEITGSGTATYSGEVGTKFYTPTDPGILINIYTALTSYVIPGPALISGASSGSTPASSVATSAAASTEAGSAPATSAPATSAPATSAPATSAASVSTAATVVTSAAVRTISMLPPYSNSSTFSSKKSKSTCKSKSKRPSTTALPTGSNAAISTTSAASVTIPTSAPVVAPQATSDSAGASSATAVTPTSAPTSTPSSTPSTGSDKMTLDSVLAWISDFYNKFKGATYDGSSTLTRRHPRAF